MAAAGVRKVELSELLKSSDFISVHVPHNAATHHLLGAAELAQMKPSCMLVNTARGPVIDEAAMLGALRSGALAAAAVDVLEVEPLEPGHMVQDLENLLVTPHNASSNPQQFDRFIAEAVETMLSFARGEVPTSVVNPRVLEQQNLRMQRTRPKL